MSSFRCLCAQRAFERENDPICEAKRNHNVNDQYLFRFGCRHL